MRGYLKLFTLISSGALTVTGLGACWSNPAKRDRHRSAVVI